MFVAASRRRRPSPQCVPRPGESTGRAPAAQRRPAPRSPTSTDAATSRGEHHVSMAALRLAISVAVALALAAPARAAAVPEPVSGRSVDASPSGLTFDGTGRAIVAWHGLRGPSADLTVPFAALSARLAGGRWAPGPRLPASTVGVRIASDGRDGTAVVT